MKALAILLVLTVPARAQQTDYAAGQAAQPLSRVPASARSGALGLAGMALSQGREALWHDRSSLAGLKGMELGLDQGFWLLGALQEQLSFALPGAAWGDWGFSAQFVDFGSFELRNAAGLPGGSARASAQGLGLAWARGVAHGLAFGLGLNAWSEQLAGPSSFSLASSLGLSWDSGFHGICARASYSGLGLSAQGQALASGLEAGLFAPFKLGRTELDLGGAMRVDTHDAPELGLGAEWRIPGAALRAGYTAPLASNQLGGLAGLSLGAGLDWKRLSLSYAFLPFGVLGEVQRLGLAWKFYSKEPEAPSGPGSLPPPLQNQAQALSPSAQSGQALADPAKSGPPPGLTERVEVQFVVKKDILDKDRAPEEKKLYEALEKDPKDQASWRALGNFYYKSGQRDRCLQAFEKCLELKEDPELKAWVLRYIKN